MLGQSQVVKYLDQCNGDLVAIEEVLSAYIVWKYLKGSTSAQVLMKIKLLTIFLRVTGRRQLLETAADVFKVLTLEVSLGGGRVGQLAGQTVQGKAIWNELRRRSPNLVTDGVYGGPGPVHTFLSNAQSRPFSTDTATRTPWAERYFVARQAFGRVPVLHEDTSAGQRVTTLPAYVSRDYALASPFYVPIQAN
ncbi:hypothetical protein MIND_00497700 [Mycena indigotica]|uniref:Uncharacterized protein n=1 Tax=Mycena indigotica TaxID=2126181 RepID=A0A8H6SYM8_9AGAR|nr:uncharacterized protein MIND_00497700 [Mycena indigotica]KAF7307046.1 hypothetical protein MIND_00497700 [Mycena indigotica]